MQAAQHMSEAIADILRSRATAAWGPALSAADLLYRVTPIDLEAPSQLLPKVCAPSLRCD